MSNSVNEFIKNIPTELSEIEDLLEEMLKIFKSEPSLIKVPKGPCLFIGDTHGDLGASRKIIKKFFQEKDLTLIFLGDYVDRGAKQIENVLFLFLVKRDYPKRVILLRGNHEEKQMNINYGFRNLLTSKFRNDAKRLFTQFQNTFAQLPLCVLTWNRVFGVHGGIPISMKDQPVQLEEIIQRKRGTTDIEHLDFITVQMLWNDPKEQVQGAVPSSRGIGFYFGRDKFEQFLAVNDIRLVIRSHEVFQEGFKYFFNKKLISIFSALDYVYLHGIQGKMVRLDTEGNVKLEDIAD